MRVLTVTPRTLENADDCPFSVPSLLSSYCKCTYSHLLHSRVLCPKEAIAVGHKGIGALGTDDPWRGGLFLGICTWGEWEKRRGSQRNKVWEWGLGIAPAEVSFLLVGHHLVQKQMKLLFLLLFLVTGLWHSVVLSF